MVWNDHCSGGAGPVAMDLVVTASARMANAALSMDGVERAAPIVVVEFLCLLQLQVLVHAEMDLVVTAFARMANAALSTDGVNEQFPLWRRSACTCSSSRSGYWNMRKWIAR
jgi:hypothetical protein